MEDVDLQKWMDFEFQKCMDFEIQKWFKNGWILEVLNFRFWRDVLGNSTSFEIRQPTK